MANRKIKLKNCRVCGMDAGARKTNLCVPGDYYVECQICGFKTKLHKTQSAATLEWNGGNRAELFSDRLREYAKSAEHPWKMVLQQAADQIENQQSEIESLAQIVEAQANLSHRAVQLALELDAAKAEIARLNKENFWLTGGKDA